MSEAPITFLPLSAAPPRGALALLEGVLTADKLTAYTVFKDLADGWEPTVYVTDTPSAAALNACSPTA